MIIDNFQIFILYFNYQLSIYEVYNIKSRQAEEFINHQEVLDTLEYAQINRNNRPLIESLIDKALCARVFPIGKQPCCWNVTSRDWWSASSIWHAKSNRNSMVTAS